jgi:SPOR domain
MSDADWGGPNGAQNGHRYYPQTPSAQPHGGHYGAYATPQGVAPHYAQPAQMQAQHYGQPPQYGAPQPYAASHGYEEPHLETPGVPGGAGPGLGGLLHGAGALLSVALIAGLAVWGYQLAVRDVTGVPVVRALEGPMRIQPEDPGGVAAAHQGLAVNTIAAEGQAEGPAAQVELAPAPVVLDDSDVPARSDTGISAMTMAEADEALPVDEEELVPEPVALTDGEGDDVAEALAMANALAAGAQPLSGEEADLDLTAEAETRIASAVVPASVPGVARSPRPEPRPEDIVARAAASPVDLAVASATAALPGVREIDASQVVTGTRLVQLGAFDSEGVAREAWDKIALRFPEMLEDKDRVVEMAQSGGKTFYRLRAMGFEDLSDARRFCAALMAGQAACIPVVTR